MHHALKQLSVLLLAISAASALASDAYTWTDSEGVRHFSESAPAAAEQSAERVELKSAPVIPGPPPERYRSISDQAARLQADRQKRELAREKRRQLERSQQAYDQERESEAEGVSEIYLYHPYPYWYPPYRRHHYPHHPRPPRHRYPPPRHRFDAGKTLTQRRNAEALRQQRWHW